MGLKNIRHSGLTQRAVVFPSAFLYTKCSLFFVRIALRRLVKSILILTSDLDVLENRNVLDISCCVVRQAY